MKRTRERFLILVLSVCFLGLAPDDEVVYLANGDIIHGELVSANNTTVTIETKYGKLEIPKEDIERIGDIVEEAVSESEDVAESSPSSGTSSLSLNITGVRSGTRSRPRPTRAYRLQLGLGSASACTFVDEKPDTVDGDTLYNSFTFSPTDSQLVGTAEGYECAVERADDGNVWVAVSLADIGSGRRLVRMSYEINEGSESSPIWTHVVERSFSVEVEPGKQTVVALRQDASGLDYSGMFNKSMKNLDLFELNVLSTELRD